MLVLALAASLPSAVGASAATSFAASGASGPEAGLLDPHIRVVMYDPDRVTPLRAFFGFQMMIQFGSDERLENVAVGDATAWQITPNKGANRLFIKPVDHAGHTNMTVVTDRRSYLFDLTASPAEAARPGELVYLLRFAYPPEPAVAVLPPPPPPPPPEQRNRAYTYTGSLSLLPALVFDDGQFTYFKWPDGASTPAVFLLAKDGTESLVDYSFRDGYQVVEQVAARFRLRDGKAVTTVINDGWREPTPDAAAPRPHDARTAREAARDQEGR